MTILYTNWFTEEWTEPAIWSKLLQLVYSEADVRPTEVAAFQNLHRQSVLAEKLRGKFYVNSTNGVASAA